MRLLLVILLAIAATAQAGIFGFADVEYIPYEGDQAHWKTASGAAVDRSYKLPVYHGRPPRAYIVLGMINVSGAGGFTQVESATRDAVAEARKHGADAVVMMERGRDSAGASVIGNAQTGFNIVNRTAGHAQVIAIRWRR